jgi:hypothetical protein
MTLLEPVGLQRIVSSTREPAQVLTGRDRPKPERSAWLTVPSVPSGSAGARRARKLWGHVISTPVSRGMYAPPLAMSALYTISVWKPT